MDTVISHGHSGEISKFMPLEVGASVPMDEVINVQTLSKQELTSEASKNKEI